MAARFVFRPLLQRVVSEVLLPQRVHSRRRLLDDGRYILRELAHRCAAELEHDPATGEVLFFRVSYPLGRVLVSVCGGRHGVACVCRSDRRFLGQMFRGVEVVDCVETVRRQIE
jgi:hypothetical protein